MKEDFRYKKFKPRKEMRGFRQLGVESLRGEKMEKKERRLHKTRIFV